MRIAPSLTIATGTMSRTTIRLQELRYNRDTIYFWTVKYLIMNDLSTTTAARWPSFALKFFIPPRTGRSGRRLGTPTASGAARPQDRPPPPRLTPGRPPATAHPGRRSLPTGWDNAGPPLLRKIARQGEAITWGVENRRVVIADDYNLAVRLDCHGRDCGRVLPSRSEGRRYQAVGAEGRI